MRIWGFSGALLVCLLFSSGVHAQNTGKVECARSDGYVYLYSSMTTLDVRATLQCGEVVQITGRYDSYWAVRTAKGETGFLPLAALVVMKDPIGPDVPIAAPSPARERIHYDETPVVPTPPITRASAKFALLDATPVRVRLIETLSSARAQVGEAVEFEVVNAVKVDGVTVVREGTLATGFVSAAEPKKHFGRGGRLGFSIDTVMLVDREKLALRYHQDGLGDGSGPLSGKDVVLPKGMEFIALVDGDVMLKREKFVDSGNGPASAAEPGSQRQP